MDYKINNVKVIFMKSLRLSEALFGNFIILPFDSGNCRTWQIIIVRRHKKNNGDITVGRYSKILMMEIVYSSFQRAFSLLFVLNAE